MLCCTCGYPPLIITNRIAYFRGEVEHLFHSNIIIFIVLLLFLLFYWRWLQFVWAIHPAALEAGYSRQIVIKLISSWTVADSDAAVSVSFTVFVPPQPKRTAASIRIIAEDRILFAEMCDKRIVIPPVMDNGPPVFRAEQPSLLRRFFASGWRAPTDDGYI